jgi:hypothetical protein
MAVCEERRSFAKMQPLKASGCALESRSGHTLLGAACMLAQYKLVRNSQAQSFIISSPSPPHPCLELSSFQGGLDTFSLFVMGACCRCTQVRVYTAQAPPPPPLPRPRPRPRIPRPPPRSPRCSPRPCVPPPRPPRFAWSLACCSFTTSTISSGTRRYFICPMLAPAPEDMHAVHTVLPRT